MTLVQQQAIEFPFRKEDGGEVISAPRHLLAELRRSVVSPDLPKGLVLLSGPSSVYRLGLGAVVDRALAGEPVLYLAGANVFDPFLVGRLAGRVGWRRLMCCNRFRSHGPSPVIRWSGWSRIVSRRRCAPTMRDSSFSPVRSRRCTISRYRSPKRCASFVP